MIEVPAILAPQTGYCHHLIRRMNDAGKETQQYKEAEQERILENIQKVQPIQQTYNARGKIVERGVMDSRINLVD